MYVFLDVLRFITFALTFAMDESLFSVLVCAEMKEEFAVINNKQHRMKLKHFLIIIFYLIKNIY